MLTERMIEVLKAIVDEFIETAKSVGSNTLIRKYNLPYSSATIRNDMAALKKLGYLEVAHTSGGSIPSNKGYQFYCENLKENQLDDNLTNAIMSIFSKSTMNIEDALQESINMVSEMTNLASAMQGPSILKQTLEHIQAIVIDKHTLVCIFITNTGFTENKTFKFDDELTSDDISECIELLNDRLKGTKCEDLVYKLELIKPLLISSFKRREMLFNAFYGAFMKFASKTLYVKSSKNMLYQPEFSDINKLKKMIKLLDDPTFFQDFENDLHCDIQTQRQGKTSMYWKDDMALITNDIKIGPGEFDNAKLMVVGPRRMEYKKIVNLLDLISTEISKFYK